MGNDREDRRMLVDTERLHTATEAHQGLDYAPGDYERDKKVFVFRMTWEGEDLGDILSFADALDFVATFEGDAADADTLSEARELLNSGRAFRIGPDEDWYRIAPLAAPMQHNRAGELVGLDEPFFKEFEPPFDCRPGVDYPGSLA